MVGIYICERNVIPCITIRFMTSVMITGILLAIPTQSFIPSHPLVQSFQTSLSTELLYMRDGTNPNRPPPKPFIIERIDDVPGEGVYREIADMCIDVFFKEQLNARPEDRIP